MEIEKLPLTLQQVAGESGLEFRPNSDQLQGLVPFHCLCSVSPLTPYPLATRMELQKHFAPAFKIDEFLKLDNLIIILSEK